MAGPPTTPPYDGSGGGGGGGGGGDGAGDGGGPGGGRTPWWRSVPKVAALTAVVVAAVALTVVFVSRSDDKGDTAGSGGSGEVFLQNSSASGPDPFTASTARKDEASGTASLAPRTGTAESTTPRVPGSTAGLYGGTQQVASCDVERQVRYLGAEPAKNAAFAKVLSLDANAVPAYLRSLTPLQLRVDTRVTNHGFKDGAATTYQATLQAGTAVLVDDRGVPRVRCACGNPLTEPVPQQRPRTTGTPWPGYNASQVVVVAPSVTVVNVFVVYDPEDDSWFARKHGDTGRHDKPTPPPPRPTPTTTSPSASSTSPSGTPTSPPPCVVVTGDETPAPIDGVTPSPCPSTLSPTQTTPPPSPSTDTTTDTTTPTTETPSDTPSGTPDTPSNNGATTTDGTDTTTDTTTDDTTGSTAGGDTDGRSAAASSPSGLPLNPSGTATSPAPGPGQPVA
ncbi:DUF6777 domain-containing protein [Streptomyces hydrogenans]|uniref:DUF6777 domain-containing protein n=1 Tax=Streptomyces hydrogenans TaxID=1873719 RepID=UPI001E578ABD|nr:DUF6777 domain-containing protein [Streptomyces hydrogenans]